MSWREDRKITHHYPQLLNVLDEIELDLMLKESEQDEKAGRFITVEEMRKST